MKPCLTVRGRSAALAVWLTAAIALAPDTFAATSPAPQTSEGTTASDEVHATRGVVRAIDAHTMVIARSRDRGSMTFDLTPSTHREDMIVVGSTVSVRYREDGRNHVATAIALKQPKE
jgi:hypothetical protein